MLKIPRQQVLERWDALPDNLKEALFSESNSGIVWQVGALNHLPEEKTSMMATIVGDVIFGFLHSDDLAREIQESLNLNSQIANSISHEINRKIFTPIRTDLEKVYSPVSAVPLDTTQSKPFGEAQGRPFDKIQDRPAVFPTIIESQKIPATKLETPIIPAAPVIPTAAVPAEKSFDKVPDKPFDETLGKPFILHQETEDRPVGEKQRISSPATNWFQKTMPAVRQEKPRAPASPVKIELEVFGQKSEEPFGKAQGSPFGAAHGKEKEPVSAKTEAPKQRIVHYRETEISTPFGKPETQPRKTEMPMPVATKTEAPKPKEPKIVNFDSFATTKEKENEVGLEGNTINLKNNQ